MLCNVFIAELVGVRAFKVGKSYGYTIVFLELA